MPNKDRNCTVSPFRKRQHIADIKEALQSSPRDFCLFTVGINSGLRGADLLRLSWAHVLLRGQIRDVIEVKERKAGKERNIPISSSMRSALQAWLSVCVQNKAVDPTDVIKEDLLFPNRNGQPMSTTRLHQLVNEWAAQAGIEGHFGSHTLRKTFGYFLRKRGIDLPTIMDVFGHSNQSITLRYLGIDKDEVTEACLKLNL